MRTLKIAIFTLLLGVIFSSGVIPLKFVSITPVYAQCGGYYNEGCGSPLYQDYIAHRVHHLPHWGGHRMPPVEDPYIRRRPNRLYATPIGVPTGVGCAGCNRGHGEYVDRESSTRRRIVHVHTWYRRTVTNTVGVQAGGGQRLSVGATCTMVKPHWGERGYVWPDGDCHHLPPEYDP